MKTALKCENDKFSAMALKHLSGPLCLENRTKTPKLWAIAHENGLKTKKRQVIAHDSNKCIGANMPWESHQNPPTVGFRS